MKIIKIYKSELSGWHLITCDICSQMLKRGYRSEAKYFDDLFSDKLKPIKYKLVKAR